MPEGDLLGQVRPDLDQAELGFLPIALLDDVLQDLKSATLPQGVSRVPDNHAVFVLIQNMRDLLVPI